MAQPYLLAQNIVNGAEGSVVITINGENHVVAGLRNIKTTGDIQSEDMRVVGTRQIQQKPSGVICHGTGNVYYGFDYFRKMARQYIKTGVMEPFAIQITNDDKASGIGSETSAYYGCTLMGEIPLSILDDEESMLNYDFEFTWTDTEELESFTKPAQYGHSE